MKNILKAGCVGVGCGFVAMLIAERAASLGGIFGDEWTLHSVDFQEPLLQPWGWGLLTFVVTFAIASFIFIVRPFAK